jgi:glycosyltransferase involved in cell wall biosynthesis
MNRFRQPKISVVMPSIGRAYAQVAIASVLSQSIEDIELVVVMDPWIPPRSVYSDPPLPTDSRVRLVRPAALGRCPDYLPARIARLRNFGLEQTAGRYIAHLDDDNWWCENHLEKLSRLLDERPEIGFAHSWRTIVNEGGQPHPLETYPWSTRFGNHDAIFAKFMEYGIAEKGQPYLRDTMLVSDDEIFHVDTSEFFVRREIHDACRFRERFTLRQMMEGQGEDRSLCEDLYRAEIKSACTEDYTLFYRLGGYSNADR